MHASIETLKSQLLQLEQLHEAGALPTPEYESSKTGLEKRLLELVLAGTTPTSGTPPEGAAATGKATLTAPQPTSMVAPPVSGETVSARPTRRLLALLVGFVLLLAVGGYWVTGAPSLAGFGTPPAVADAGAAREGGAAPHSVSAEQIAEMAQRLASRLKEQPQDPQGWAMLGRSYAVLGRNDEAVKAYETAMAQQGDDAVLMADYADALAVKNNRTLAGEPMKWVRRALELDPKNVKALALAGTDAFDRKDFAGAVRYWEALLEAGPSEGGFVQQVKASVAEARQLGGLGAAAATPAATAASAGPRVAAATTGGTDAATGARTSVSGTVSLSAALGAKAAPDDTVFIFARAAEGSRMPLAVLRMRVRDLPARFTLDDRLAMSPAAKLSGAPSVIVGARISKSGNAMPSPGDLTGQVGPVPLGSAGLAVEIREQVKP